MDDASDEGGADDADGTNETDRRDHGTDADGDAEGRVAGAGAVDGSPDGPTVSIEEVTTEAGLREAYPVVSQLRDLPLAAYLDLVETMRGEGYRLFVAREPGNADADGRDAGASEAGGDGGEVVGAVGWALRHNLYSGAHLFVYDLVVDEPRRGEGIGTALLRDVHDRARGIDCAHVALESGLWRDRAHALYESLGYERYCYSFRLEL
jgi:GNAT superfamily N-acetyltransferase